MKGYRMYRVGDMNTYWQFGLTDETEAVAICKRSVGKVIAVNDQTNKVDFASNHASYLVGK